MKCRPCIFIHDPKISSFYILVQPGNKKIVMQHATVKNIPGVERPLLIVASYNINSLPSTLLEKLPSFTGKSVPGMNLASDGPVKGSLKGNAATIKTKLPEPDKSIPAVVVEIMPQYPGGIQALLSFLKKKYKFTR